MSLLERLRGALLGGESMGADPDERHRTPPTDPGSPNEPGSAGPALQSHGNHWDALVPDDGRSAAIKEATMTAVSEGDVVDATPMDGVEVAGYRHGDGPVGTVAVALDDEIATAYPVVDGVTQEVAVDTLSEWETGIEAWLGGSLRDASMTAFAANYFEHESAFFGGECSASLSLLAYDLGVPDYDTVVDEDGEELDVSDFVGFRPWERGAPDDHVVRTQVKAVDRVAHAGHGGYRLRVPLLQGGDSDVDAALFVADHVAGDYEPEVGDTVEGAGWLQAQFE